MSNEEKERLLGQRSCELRGVTNYATLVNESDNKITNDGEPSKTSKQPENGNDKFSKHRNGFQISVGMEEKKHRDYVNAVCATGDGKFIASASDDKTILVWEMINGKSVYARRLIGHNDVVVSLFAPPNNQEILSGSYDCTIKRWDLLSGEITLDIKDEDKTSHCLAVYHIAGEGYEYIIKGARSREKNEIGVIQIYGADGQLLLKLKDHANYVRCFAATSDVSSQRYLFSGSLDKTITRWDLRTCREEILKSHGKVRTLSRKSMLLQKGTDRKKLPVKLLGHSDWVRSICITKDDLRLVSCSNDKTIRIWDVHNIECIQILRGHTDGVRSVCISDDGSQIISGSQDMTVRLWDLQTGAPIRILRGHQDWITCVCTLPGTKQILSASSDKTIKLWDVYTTPMLQSFDHGSLNPVLCVCGDQESTIFTCTKDTLYVWDEDQHGGSAPEPKAAVLVANCGEREKKETLFMCMIDNDAVATGSNISEMSEHKSSVIEIWRFNNDVIEHDAKKNWIFDESKGNLTCLNYCNPIIISGFKNKTITIIYLYKSYEAQDYDCNGAVPLSISCIQYAKYYLIIAGCENKDIFIWKYFVLGKHNHSMDVSASSNMIHIGTLRGHIYPVRCLTYTTDKKYIVSGSDDYTVKMWLIPPNASTVTTTQWIKHHHSFEDHTRSVSSVCCTEDYLISSSADKMIMVWCLKHLCLLRTLIGHTDEIKMIHITQSNRLLSASKDGSMRIWDLSVGRNVPSDEELRELIRVRHEEYGFSPQVTKVIDLMTSANAPKISTVPPDVIKTSLQNAAKVGLFSQKTEKEIEEIIENTMKELLRLKTPDVTTSPYELGGMMKTFEVTVEAGAKSTKLLPLANKDGVQVPLMHWMSRIPEYRDFLLTKILPNHPELLYSCDKSHFKKATNAAENSNVVVDSKVVKKLECPTLLRKAVKSRDPDFIFRALDVLSTFVKTNSQEMMWHAHNSITTKEEKTCLLLDIEDVALALEEFWDVNNVLKSGILELQRAPQSIQDSLDKLFDTRAGDDDGDGDRDGEEGRKKVDGSTKFLNTKVWDGDGEEDRMKVDGSSNVFDPNNWENIAGRTLLFREYFSERCTLLFNFFFKPRLLELMEALYVPFPMRICQRRGYSSQHSSSLLLEVCVDGALKSSDNTSIFNSNVLTAILAFKLRMYGWDSLFSKLFFCFTLLAHFGFYSVLHVKADRNLLWFCIRLFHFLPVVVLELVPYYLSSYFCSTKHSATFNWTGVTVLTALSMLLIFFVLLVCYENPGSELDNILSAIIFFILFICAMNNLKYLPSVGLFVRMLLQVLERMRYYMLLLVLYLFGFAVTFHILMFTVIRFFDKECSDGSASECGNIEGTTERFRLTIFSWVTMYATMMGVTDWDATAFGNPFSNSAIALIVLFCLFVFVSNVVLNITISVMSDIYNKVTENEHASYHVELARYVLGIERLLLLFGRIQLEDEKYFPTWLVVLSPKKHNVQDKNTEIRRK